MKTRLAAVGYRLALLLAAVPQLAAAQPARAAVPPTAPQQPRGLQVFLVTMGEGEYYWEKFGHNALWFHDPTRGIDVAYNWGTFDFNEPGYLGRVLTGDTRYWVEAVPAPLLLEYYRESDRTITIQRLNFTPEQALRAYEYSQWNARDENKYYQYDYFRDNCSTRVRDVIDLALGGAVKAATASRQTGRSYRRESLRLVDDMRLTQFGINAALARPSDVPISEWEGMFVPSRMREALRHVRVPAPDGAQQSVVVAERVPYQSRSHHERPDAPTLWPGYLIVGLLLAAELFVVGALGEKGKAADVIFRIESTVWALLTGVLGTVLLLAWLITQHVFWYRNENLLLLNPLSLFLALLIPLAMRRARWTRAAAICAVVIAMLGAVALVVNGVPGFSQDNLAMVLLLLPPHFAVAYGLWRRAA